MKPERQRIVIAELYGAKWVRFPRSARPGEYLRFLAMPGRGGYLPKADGTEKEADTLYSIESGKVPDYPNDLNAIQAAALTLKTRKLRNAFQRRLNRRARLSGWCVWELAASVWCEEFLRLMGRWEEENGGDK